MSLSRTLLRTSRVLLVQNGVSPMQSALNPLRQAQFVNAARTYATVFERNKPHVNIGRSVTLTMAK